MAKGDETRTRILDAAVEAAAIHGITRLSVGEVARRARLSRPTLYKHFASKDALVAAAVQREAQRFVDAVGFAASEPDPRAGLEAGILAALRLARDHPLLDRIVRTEPQALLPVLTADGGPVMLLARHTVEALLAERLPTLEVLARRRLADVLTRLLVSYAISAPDDPPEVVAATLATFLVEGAVPRTDAVPQEAAR